MTWFVLQESDNASRLRGGLGFLLALAWVVTLVAPTFAQIARPSQPLDDAAGRADGGTAAAADAIAPPNGQSLRLLDLLPKGGWVMVPLGLLSILLVAIIIERFLALRSSKATPKRLMRGLNELAAGPGAIDARAAYRLCQQNPSAAARVIRSMLVRLGRSQAELEAAVRDASQREADRLYTNVRWLTLVAAVGPLLGLFGTVWGMIRAFYDTTQLQAGQNKAESLAQGIYEALVTTLAGLALAIPAAVLAHYFEGKIQAIFYRIDDLVVNLLPHIGRLETRTGQMPGPDETDQRSSGAADRPITRVREPVIPNPHASG